MIRKGLYKALVLLIVGVMMAGLFPQPQARAAEEEPASVPFTAKLTITDTVEFSWTASAEWQAATATIWASDEPIADQTVGSAAVAAENLSASGTLTLDLKQASHLMKPYYAIRWTSGGTVSPVTNTEVYSFLPRIEPGLQNLQHPYLFTTPEEIQTLKSLIATHEWYTRTYNILIEQAELAIINYGGLTKAYNKNDSKHGGLTEAARTLANAYVLTDDTRYAQAAKHILLLYADYYSRTDYIYNQKKDDGNVVFALTWAYDLIINSPVMSETDRTTIENGYFREAVERLQVLFRYPMANQGVTNWAVATIGFLLQDQAYLDYAFDDPGYGLKYNMVNGFLDDGFWWEESVSYHEGRLDSFIWLAEAARRSNYDLYNYKASGERNPLQPAAYPGRSMESEDKSIKELLDFMFYYLFPDLTRPAHGDSIKSILSPQYVYEAAYNQYQDPKYAWLLSQFFGEERDLTGVPSTTYTMFWAMNPSLEAGEFYIGNGYFDKLGYNKLGSSVFMDSGQAILRSEGGVDKSNNLVFKWDQLGSPGHGHSDKLSIILYGLGKEILLDPGRYTYGTAEHKEFARQTIAHNTLVVDERSMLPQKDTDTEFIGDALGSTTAGYLDAMTIGPVFKSARAGNDRAYADLGVSLNRTVAEIDDYMIDVFRAESATAHKYDYPLLINGTLESSSIALQPEANPETRLGGTLGYKHIKNLSKGSTDGLWQTDWNLGVRGRFRTTMLGEPGTAVVKGSGTNASKVFDKEMLISRRSGIDKTAYFTIMEPYRETSELRNITELPVTGDNAYDALAAQIVTPARGTADVYMTGTGGVAKSAGNLSSDGQSAFLRTTGGQESVAAVVGGTSVGGQSLSFQLADSAAAQLTSVASNVYRFDFDGAQSTSVSLQGMPAQAQVYELALKDTNELTPVASSSESGSVVFTAEPGRIYVIATSAGAGQLPEPAKLPMGLQIDESTVGKVKIVEQDRQGILIEAEDFSLEDGGKVTIAYKNASHSTLNPLGDAFFGWDKRGHILEWQFQVPEQGQYRIMMRYASAVLDSVRQFQIDGGPERVFYFPRTPGWNDRANALLQDSEGNDILYALSPGTHTIRMTNFTNGLNLDYLVVQKVEDIQEPLTGGKGAISIDETERRRGDEAKLTAGVSEMQGSFKVMDVIVDYDPDVLEFDTVTEGGSVSLAPSAVEPLMPGYAMASAVKEEQGKVRVILFGLGDANPVGDNTSVFRLKARVKDSAAPGRSSVALRDFRASDNGTTVTLDTYAAQAELTIRLADNAMLKGRIAQAQSVHDTATEGMAPGQYPAGSKASLLASIQAAAAVSEDYMATQEQLDAALTALQAALQSFYDSVFPGVVADKTALTSAIAHALRLHGKATEGNRIGQYAVGSKASLLQAIDAAEAVYENVNASQALVNNAVSALNAASSAFAGSIITLVPGATYITIGDLSIIASYYGVTQQDAAWSEVEVADVLNLGEIDIRTLEAIARMILDYWLEE